MHCMNILKSCLVCWGIIPSNLELVPRWKGPSVPGESPPCGIPGMIPSLLRTFGYKIIKYQTPFRTITRKRVAYRTAGNKKYIPFTVRIPRNQYLALCYRYPQIAQYHLPTRCREILYRNLCSFSKAVTYREHPWLFPLNISLRTASHCGAEGMVHYSHGT